MQVPYKPNQSHTEMLVDQALQSYLLPPEQIRAIRPLVPQQLFPQTRGFNRQEMTIMDVLDTPRTMPNYSRLVSGAPVMFRDGFMEGNFEGSSRYSMQGLWA
jgi:hypothetical protein